MVLIPVRNRLPEGRRAFTLIELLVVIAIIALLAGILFPVFGRARENGRRASCQSNLKQIALGWHQYTQDYDGWFPSIGGLSATGTGCPVTAATIFSDSQAQRLQPYLKSTQLFKCPSDTKTGATCSYGVNGQLGINVVSAKALVHDSEILQPTKVVMWFEDKDFTNSVPMRTIECHNWADVFGQDFDDKRHLDGQNVVLIDGHVKWFKGLQNGLNTQSGISFLRDYSG